MHQSINEKRIFPVRFYYCGRLWGASRRIRLKGQREIVVRSEYIDLATSYETLDYLFTNIFHSSYK